MLHHLAAVATKSNSGWLTFAAVMTAVVGLLGFVWVVFQDRIKNRRVERTEGESRQQREDRQAVDYVKQALDGFEELVSGLRVEVERLRQQRDVELKRYQENESRLTQEIVRLRAEVTVLRQVLSNNKITIAQAEPRPALEGEGA